MIGLHEIGHRGTEIPYNSHTQYIVREHELTHTVVGQFRVTSANK